MYETAIATKRFSNNFNKIFITGFLREIWVDFVNGQRRVIEDGNVYVSKIERCLERLINLKTNHKNRKLIKTEKFYFFSYCYTPIVIKRQQNKEFLKQNYLHL